MSGRKYASKKQRKSSEFDGKKKKIKRKKVIDHSIIKKNQNFGERELVTGIDSEIPAKNKFITSKLKLKKARKSSSYTNFISIPMQMDDMVSFSAYIYENKKMVKKNSHKIAKLRVYYFRSF